MKQLPEIFTSFKGLLTKPGDSLLAKVTDTGLQVLSLHKGGIKHTVVRYPSTGTTVETIVHRKR